MKVRITATVVSLMLLTACSESSPQEFSSAPAPETSSSVETAATTVTSAEPAKETTTVQKKPAKKYKDIEADVVALEGDRLKFIFEGEEYDLPVSEGNLSGRTWGSSSKTLEEMIAGNRFGIPVKADIRVDEDMTQIKKIDIFKPNGRLINGYGTNGQGATEEELMYRFKRTGGSLCEFTNSKETLCCDLNDLPMCLKWNYPEVIDDIYNFTAFEFSDGSCLLYDLNTVGDVLGDVIDSYNKNNSFFATVQSVSDGKAAFILNDGKTVCTAPTYFNDGEVTEGMRVMVTLDEDTALYGSGDSREYDYAVFYTDEEVFNHSAFGFDEIAYAQPASNWTRFAYTYIRQLEQ